jgi:hypothetical protein
LVHAQNGKRPNYKGGLLALSIQILPKVRVFGHGGFLLNDESVRVPHTISRINSGQP